MLRVPTMTGVCLVLLLALVLAPAPALAGGDDPRKVVVKTTERVMALIEEAREYIDEDPRRYYREVDRILDDVVDFDTFARGVMGRFASRQRYDALGSDEERRAFREQVERFSGTFRSGLVETYARGLLAFNGQRIDVLPLRPGAAEQGTATVVQHIHGEADRPYVVQYTMRRDSSGQWKLRNVVIEGINIGATYRNQFASAVEQHRGDIDKVIDNWRVEPEGLEVDELTDSRG